MVPAEPTFPVAPLASERPDFASKLAHVRVAVAGSSGLIGSALCQRLESEGHQVTRLVRRPWAARRARLSYWDPSTGAIDQ